MDHKNALITKQQATIEALDNLVHAQALKLKDVLTRLDKRSSAGSFHLSREYIHDLIGIAGEMERGEHSTARHRLEQWLEEVEPRWRSIL